MNIDIVGILSVWLNLIWLIYWPFILAPVYLFIKRKKIKRKWLHLFLTIIVCFASNYIVEYTSTYFIVNFTDQAQQNFIFDHTKLISLFLLIVKVAIALAPMNLYSRSGFFSQKQN